MMSIFGPPNVEKLKLKNDIRGLIKALSYKGSIDAMNIKIREQAARALGEIKDSSAIGPLVAALKDPDSSVRWSVARVLDEMNWVPQTENERALYVIASQQWSEAVRLAVAPKVCVKSSDPSYLRTSEQAIPQAARVSEEQADYVIHLKWTDTVVGHYSSGQKAVRRDCTCSITKRSTGILVSSELFMGDKPPELISAAQMGTAYGIPDLNAISRYIEQWYKATVVSPPS